MPKRMTIEVVEHSPSDVRIVFVDVNSKERIRYFDKEKSLKDLVVMILASTFYNSSVGE